VNFWQEVLFNAIAYAVTLLVVAVAAGLLFALYPQVKEKFWPLARLRKGGWTGIEVLLSFVIIFELAEVVRQILLAVGFFESRLFEQSPSGPRQMLWSIPLHFFLSLALVLSLLYGVSDTRPRHLGLTRARWPQNVVQGLIGFAVVTPVALGLYVLVMVLHKWVLGLPEQPHILEKVAKEGLSSFEWGLLAFQACIAAPLLEELGFRGLLQGWLRRASVAGHIMLCVWTLFIASFPLIASLEDHKDAPPPEVGWQAFLFAAALIWLYVWQFLWVWRGVLREGPAYLVLGGPPGTNVPATEPLRNGANDDDEDEEEERKPRLQLDPVRWKAFEAGNVRLALLGSAMLFAVVHSAAWPSPIPLFLLGLALGWLAQRTQSLLGPIVMHACFNAVALGGLILLHTYGDTKGKAATDAARPPAGETTLNVVPASQTPRFK
jgi:membrane protease YdiL (CAAX protease family)